jgi:hypothetical protein
MGASSMTCPTLDTLTIPLTIARGDIASPRRERVVQVSPLHNFDLRRVWIRRADHSHTGSRLDGDPKIKQKLDFREIGWRRLPSLPLGSQFRQHFQLTATR